MDTKVDAVSAGNRHIVCQYVGSYSSSFGTFLSRSPLNYGVPLILLQLALISMTSLILEVCLSPLGQSSIVSQILGGVLYGPSVLGRANLFANSVFPPRSVLTLKTFATFGIMFFFFAVGVKQDTDTMIRPGRRAAIIGISAMFGTLALTLSFVFLLIKYVDMDETLAHALPLFAAFQCLTAFPNVACLLTEIKMDSSDLGQMAISTSLLCDVIGISLVAVVLGILQSGEQHLKAVMMLLTTLAFVLGLIFVVGPIIRRIVRTIPAGRSLPERYAVLLFLGTLVVGLISEVIGQHFMLGPLVFGLMVPDGQPLGEPMISKLDYPIGKFLYPTFLTTSGLKTNFFSVDPWSLCIAALVVFIACASKVVSVVAMSHFYGMKPRDAFVLGLMLNARGVCELVVFNLFRDAGVFTDQEFALSIGSVVLVTAVIAPLIKLLYDPTKSFVTITRRTILHMKRDVEFRILVCIKNQESVPSIVNLLEASSPRIESPIAVIAVLLIKLVGRATPMLVAHQTTRMLQPTNSRSGRIINALHQYEICHEDCVTLQSFSAVSHLQTTHNDICRLALDQNATIVILPFHKHWEIDGSIWSEDKAMQNMNTQVMNRAPCSVGILVDRGLPNGLLSMANNQAMMGNSQAIYRVAIIYIGGADDAEAMSYGSRMGRHPNVALTIIRFLLFGYDTARERRQDNRLIDDVRQSHIDNRNFMYQEQVVKDGVDLASSLKGLENCFDLLLVGKHHQASEILMGLGTWSECPELGVIGDMLASMDFGTTASVLVVQQQRLHRDKDKKGMLRPPVMSHEQGRPSAATSMSD